MTSQRVQVRPAEATLTSASEPSAPNRPQLKWRAKGSTPAQTVGNNDDRSVNTLASHSEPSTPTPASRPAPAAPPRLTQPTEPQAAPQQPAEVLEEPGEPSSQAAAAPAGEPETDDLTDRKALFPAALFGPNPPKSERKTNPAVDQRAMIPSFLARVGLDKLPIRLPEKPPLEPMPAMSARVAPVAHCVPMRRPVRANYDLPPRVAVHGPPPARATKSYYAPPTEYYVPEPPVRNEQVAEPTSGMQMASQTSNARTADRPDARLSRDTLVPVSNNIAGDPNQQSALPAGNVQRAFRDSR